MQVYISRELEVAREVENCLGGGVGVGGVVGLRKGKGWMWDGTKEGVEGKKRERGRGRGLFTKSLIELMNQS